MKNKKKTASLVIMILSYAVPVIYSALFLITTATIDKSEQYVGIGFAFYALIAMVIGIFVMIFSAVLAIIALIVYAKSGTEKKNLLALYIIAIFFSVGVFFLTINGMSWIYSALPEASEEISESAQCLILFK